ncbi:MAG: WG repeat-containing protein [Steroidobacteraceae bacterium]
MQQAKHSMANVLDAIVKRSIQSSLIRTKFVAVLLSTLTAAFSLNDALAASASARGFTKVPAGSNFESRFMPFRSASPLKDYGAMGSSQWITLQSFGQPTVSYLHVPSLLLYSSAPSGSNSSAGNVKFRRGKGNDASSADISVSAIWTNRSTLTAWLDFTATNEALRNSLRNQGRLPQGVSVQALGDAYAEITTSAENQAVVLRSAAGKILQTEAPIPTWVEPLFHEVFIACIASTQTNRPPLSPEVLGNRFESNRSCGLMSHEGRWLARPEFQFMEVVSGIGSYINEGPFLLLLRGDEPCVSTLHAPVEVACLGKPLSSLLANGLPFSRANPDSPRRGGDAIGFLAANGRWMIEPKFRSAQAFSGLIATVEMTGVPGVVVKNGMWLTPAAPTDPIAARWLSFRGSGETYGEGVINRAGEMIIPFLFPKVDRIDQNHFRVCNQQGCDSIAVNRVVDSNSAKSITPNVSAKIIKQSAQWVPTAENGVWGYQDVGGQWMLRPRFDDAEPFKDGVAKVKIGELWGEILPDGQWLHEAGYFQISESASGVAVARYMGGLRALLRADGRRIELDDRSAASLFSADGLAIASNLINRNVGFIDQNGEWVIQPKFAKASAFSDGYAIVGGYLPPDWRPSMFKEPPYIVRSIYWLSPGVIVIRALVGGEERLGLMDNNGNWLVPQS